MNIPQIVSDPTTIELEPAVQAALFILNGVAPGKDYLSRVASCFECSNVPKSTFVAEEGLEVCRLHGFTLPDHRVLTRVSFIRQRMFL